jgi:diaminopimelate epimerase
MYQAQVDVDLDRQTLTLCSREGFTEQPIYEKLQADAQQYLRKAGL